MWLAEVLAGTNIYKQFCIKCLKKGLMRTFRNVALKIWKKDM